MNNLIDEPDTTPYSPLGYTKPPTPSGVQELFPCRCGCPGEVTVNQSRSGWVHSVTAGCSSRLPGNHHRTQGEYLGIRSADTDSLRQMTRWAVAQWNKFAEMQPEVLFDSEGTTPPPRGLTFGSGDAESILPIELFIPVKTYGWDGVRYDVDGGLVTVARGPRYRAVYPDVTIEEFVTLIKAPNFASALLDLEASRKGEDYVTKEREQLDYQERFEAAKAACAGGPASEELRAFYRR